ncbi:unnamed protein product [Fusarium venenatum]|uniref:Uncharacterized protein n=1 Tax=Fusarium venenatum TaxID=56646 RepID=A0A2L2TF78_9HYPO|nr:uncharacterized protein FVRRES_12893 [Fusarium venenatum]CEI40202.1 unnamed protein product [Fusarium venenatum]
MAQETQPIASILLHSTFVQLLEIDGRFEGAVFDKGSSGDIAVVTAQAHNKTQIYLRVGVKLAGAKFNDIAHAFRRAVHAVDAIVGGWPEGPTH